MTTHTSALTRATRIGTESEAPSGAPSSEVTLKRTMCTPSWSEVAS